MIGHNQQNENRVAGFRESTQYQYKQPASTQLLTKLCELQKREITDNIQNTEW